ncbi:hypothetical protein M407DRAFT_34722, partial [Tulasnella calospora MUT 4182]
DSSDFELEPEPEPESESGDNQFSALQSKYLQRRTKLGQDRKEACMANPNLSNLVSASIFRRVWEDGFQSDEFSMDEEEKLDVHKDQDQMVYLVQQPSWLSRKASSVLTE